MNIHRIQILPATLLLATALAGCGKPEANAPTVTPATNAPAPATQDNAALEKLRGGWLRADGGYVIEINSVADDGRLEARYLNPRPINVAKAEASLAGETVKVFIELRDVNYPGSTYTLTYDPATDRLDGSYFAAALDQTLDVAFTRVTP